MNPDKSDHEIVEGCRKGDPKYQRLFFDRFSRGMMALCLRYVGSHDRAQDILQDGFIKAFEKIDQYSGKGSLGGWLRMIMINTALIAIRKEKRMGYKEELDEVRALDSKEYDVLEKMAADDLMELVQNMPTGYRTVFNLFAIEGFGHKEIAEKLEISENTSKTQFFKARKYLIKELEALRENEGRR